MDIQNARVNTAGAYVCINGCFVFAIGIRPYHGHIPVVRLGGHREGNETGWQCAAREVYEEANLQIHPISPPVTYLSDWERLDSDLQEIQWHPKTEQEPVPVLIVSHCYENDVHLSLMYLAHAVGTPVPSSEVKGLLLLERKDIDQLCKMPTSLEQYLCAGRRAILKGEFDTKLLLEPFAQLRLLSRILSIQPEIDTASS